MPNLLRDRVSVEFEYEELGADAARLWAVTTVDGAKYRNVHVSGPRADVRAYYAGELSFEDLQKLWIPK